MNPTYGAIFILEKYSSDWRGTLGKDVGRATGARVQISPYSLLFKTKHSYSIFCRLGGFLVCTPFLTLIFGLATKSFEKLS